MPANTLSEASGIPISTQELSHLCLWQEAVASNPDKPALVSSHQKACAFKWMNDSFHDEEHVVWTFAQLDKAARGLANTLNRLMPAGRRPIAALINSQAEWALFFWAAAYLHVPLMPINPKCAVRSDEISHMLNLTKPAAIVSASCEIAKQLEQNLDTKTLDDVPVKLVLARENNESGSFYFIWSLFSDMMSGELTPPDTPLPPDNMTPALILFTSGTTSLPKPCVHTSAQIANSTLAYMDARKITEDHSLMHHLPCFHAYGIIWGLVFWLAGGHVVYPSAVFSAQASLSCIDRFRCTHTSLVPTTAQAVLAHLALTNTDLSSLVSIDVSGAGVLPSVVKSCERVLGIPIYTSYGMTESPGMIIWPEGYGSVIRNDSVLSGYPSRGVTVRVCEHGTRTMVPKGQVGELHCSGIQVISGYLDTAVPSDAFYVDDEGKQWVVTGDQAIMSEDGAICISGRYKDLIIRGGENISPASIEEYLNKVEGIEMAQVVGTPDEMAGEVPIAIIKTWAGHRINGDTLKQATIAQLGPASSPKMILNLKDDLNLDTYPTTASGKVRKGELAQIVRDYLRNHTELRLEKNAATVDSLIMIWSQISGTDVLLPETSIQSFADSLMMMQLSGIVKAQLGKDVTVEDFKNCATIQHQADLIDCHQQRSQWTARHRREGPPILEDLVHAKGSEEIFLQTQRSVDSTLIGLDLGWSDVEDIMPLPDCEAVFTHRSRPQSWNLRWSYRAPVSSQQLEAAVKETLAYHPTLRSVSVELHDGPTLLVSVRPSQAWFDASLTSGWEVDTEDDLNELLLGHPDLDRASHPGPLFKIHVATIRNNGSSGMVVVASHAVIDASITKLWLDDMHTAMTGHGALLQHSLYIDYATAYFNHKHGAEAQAGIQYWAQKLKGVALQPKNTYWPPQRAPEWFKGCDYGWRRWNGSMERESERSVLLSKKTRAQKGMRRLARVESIASLKSKHNVPVFMLVKAAVAILNIKKTGATEAIFGTVNAARTWPFSSDYSAMERELYCGNPLDISGCTVEYVLDRLKIDISSSLVDWMQHVAREEDLNSKYAHTPLFSVIDRLRQPMSLDDVRSQEQRNLDAESLIPLIRRQSFNWLPISPMAQKSPQGLEMVEMLSRMDNGLTITGFLADDKCSVALSLSWDAEHMTEIEAESAIEDLVSFVDLMGKEENWLKPIKEVFDL